MSTDHVEVHGSPAASVKLIQKKMRKRLKTAKAKLQGVARLGSKFGSVLATPTKKGAITPARVHTRSNSPTPAPPSPTPEVDESPSPTLEVQDSPTHAPPLSPPPPPPSPPPGRSKRPSNDSEGGFVL